MTASLPETVPSASASPKVPSDYRKSAHPAKQLDRLPYTEDITDFLDYQRPRLTRATLRQYDYELRRVTAVLTEAGLSARPKDIGIRQITYLRELWDGQDIAVSTQRARFRIWSSYCAWNNNNVFKRTDIPYSKPMSRNVQWLTTQQLLGLTNALTEPMLRCAVVLMSLGCLRRIECIRLRVTDVDFVHRVIRVTGKGHIGGKIRTIPMVRPLETALRRWMDKRGRMVRSFLDRYPDAFHLVPDTVFFWKDTDGNLGSFSEFGGGWDNRIVTPMKEYCRDVLHCRVSCHVLRRTGARSLWQNGAKLELIQQYLGHEDLSTTMLYIGVTSADLYDDISATLDRMEQDYGKPFE